MDFVGVFKSKPEHSEDFFVLLPCLGKHAILQWFMKEGMIANKRICPKCNSDMQLKERDRRIDGYEWICKKQEKIGAHEISWSVRGGSWFEGSHLSLCDIMKLTSVWFGKCKQKYARRVCNVSEDTSVEWYNFNRLMCMVRMLSDDVCEKLGGYDKIVEIDELKLGKMKNGREKSADGKWVFGGIERGSRKCFFREVDDRKKETLFFVVKDWVFPGTIIISDCWAAYKCFEDKRFQSLATTRSLHFVDPATGTHTNSIEGTWPAIKRGMPRKHEKNHFGSYLAEYMWRRTHDHLQTDEAFKKYIKDLVKVYPPSTTG